MNKHTEAREFLQSHHLGVLSTLKDGKPWSAAVYFALGEHFVLYFLTATNGHKFLAMQQDPHVAFVVADDNAQTTVQLTGTVERLPIGEEMDKAYSELAGIHAPGGHSWEPPVSKLHQAELAVMKITPDFLQYADYNENDEDNPGHQYITQII